MVTVETSDITRLEARSGMPRPGGLEGDEVTLYFRGNDGEFSGKHISTEQRFPASAYIEKPTVPENRPVTRERFLLLAVTT